MQQELNRLREQLKNHEKELKDREMAAANGASGASTVRATEDGSSEAGGEDREKSAMENIDAGRIRFSELTLGSLLGSGSFADVYRAEWRMPCAVKKMKGRISKEQMTEFVREGEMMRSLKHPGIVKLLGVCVENGSFYLVQEIVNGFGNLFDYLHKKKCRLSYWQVIQISNGICDAMTYLHERHIVHRDLKPQNCLLVNEKGQNLSLTNIAHKASQSSATPWLQQLDHTLLCASAPSATHPFSPFPLGLSCSQPPDSHSLSCEPGEVKLCDFGLARLKNHAFVETVSNTAGTPAYQAPEMLRDEPISEKVDLYGFGIMLWEMYTGKLPW